MPVDPNIALQVQTPDTATPIYNAVNQDQAMKIKAQQELKLIYDNASERDKMRLQSVIGGAAQLKPFLDSQDYQGAENFLTRRKNDIQTRINNGETWLDTTETDDALNAIKSKNYQELHNSVNSLIAAGQFYGLGNKDLPSGVQEYNYFKGLSPQEQQDYLNVKRNPSVIDLGDKKIINPSSLNSQVLPVGLKPQDQPDNAKKKERAKAEGKIGGENQGQKDKSFDNYEDNKSLLENTSKLLETATGSGVGAARDWTAGLVGYSTDGAIATGQLKINAAKLTMQIPRMEGPQSDKDTALYKEAAGNLADATLPVGIRKASLERMIELNEKYNPKNQPTAGQTLNWSDF